MKKNKTDMTIVSEKPILEWPKKLRNNKDCLTMMLLRMKLC